MINAKAISLVRNTVVLPGYELTCPHCNHKIHFEKELMSCCSNVYCDFCQQKVEL
ncbi:hypothetical protein KY330_00460 [Candidatus Woesearchaeota archaeon]|nr:hypothetical protein [Candidatus Woesearchaeota archaeon]